MGEKNGKHENPRSLRSPAVKTAVGVAPSPAPAGPTLDAEELSGSLLVEEPDDPNLLTTLTQPGPAPVFEPVRSPADEPFARAPSIRPPNSDVELTTLPRGKLDPVISALRRMLEQRKPDRPGAKRPRRIAWPLPLVALAGLAVGVGLVVTIVTANRSRARPGRLTGAALPSASAPTSAMVPVPTPVVARESGSSHSSPVSAGCSVAGKSRVIAANATLAAGVEVRSFGDEVAVAFASTEHLASLVRLDPTSLSVSDSISLRSAEPIRRALPIPGKKGHLDLAVDAEPKGDSLQGRRTLPLDPPLQVGASGGELVWAEFGRQSGGRLWPLEGDGRVEALRGARSETDLSSVAISFRRSGAVWLGVAELKDVLHPRGNLWRVQATGSNVGSPALAFNDGVVIAAWADRSSPEDGWQLRWVRYKTGEAPGAVRTFSPPPGGRGQHAMSPGLAAVPGQGFLLVWTEGPVSAHEVRALTLSSEGEAAGSPLAVSNAGANAGQGQAAVASSGRGIITFLRSSPAGFEVVATPIACGH